MMLTDIFDLLVAVHITKEEKLTMMHTQTEGDALPVTLFICPGHWPTDMLKRVLALYGEVKETEAGRN